MKKDWVNKIAGVNQAVQTQDKLITKALQDYENNWTKNINAPTVENIDYFIAVAKIGDGVKKRADGILIDKKTGKVIPNEFRELDVWSRAKNIVNSTGEDDKLFFKHPVKSPFLDIYDHLIDIAKELENPNDH